MRTNLPPYVCPNLVARVAILALCFTGLISQALAQQITVAVVDSARVPAGTRASAEQEAGRILKSAGISVKWVDVTIPADVPANDIVLQIVPEAGPMRDPRTMGAALAADEGGIYASIFFDRVCQRAANPLSNDAHVELAPLMGHAIAHEIGHLLLGTNSHSSNGLMSALWRAGDLRRMGKGQFNFQPGEAAKMQSEVKRRTSGKPQAATAEAR